ncbi:sensor domain-containing phosphodiesterase [Roseateles cavernae]|uniref:sensor domain-containing phosphodiesterase n=1 Tax=Roseateles cavernae TaxID=3153578 RepID=UPI0032E3FE6B
MATEVESTLLALYEAISEQDGIWQGRHGDCLLSSSFQPIYSFPHRRPVGYEALVRVQDGQGRLLSPMSLFERVGSFEEQVRLDRLCRLLHVHNFVAQQAQDSWLFLNVHAAVFVNVAEQAEMLARAVEVVHQLGLPMQRLVFEVTEDVMSQDHKFELAVEQARATGCLLALDDFGVGHSNFDRIWRIRPEIVKLDRSLLTRAMDSKRIARVLSQMVALLHECGALVLLEGVETQDEAHLALDADVDLVQGYAFGHPSPQLLSKAVSGEVESAWELFDQRHLHLRHADEERVAPFLTALTLALQPLQQGRPLAEACAAFLRLEQAQLCYLLDEQGREQGERVAPSGRVDVVDPRYAPLERAGDARWARRPYFRRAIASVGEVQVTRPYLSLHGARMCVTVSVAFWRDGQLRVLCGDIDWGLAEGD